MQKTTRLNEQFRNIMKIFCVSVAVYLALTVKVSLIWEPDDVLQFDYLESEQALDESSVSESEESDAHWSSSVFSKLCNKYKNICQKINWTWEIPDTEKAKKLAYVVYLLQNLDRDIKRWNNPSEALAAMIINEQKWSRRGSANRDTITINLWWITYDNEFFQVISHEIWHIIDLWWLQWTSSKKSPIFTEFNKQVFWIDDPSIEYYKYSWTSETVRKSWVSKEDFCSGYGMSDPFEDFAECHNLYINHHDYFRHIAMNNNTMKNKYNFFSNLYWWKYINNSEVKYEDRDNSYRARDTTKLREW